MRYLVVFDLDNTLVKGNSSFQFCFHLVRRGILSKRALFYTILYAIGYHFFFLSLKELHERIFSRILCGFSLPILAEEAARFVASLPESRFYPPAMAYLAQAKERGDVVLLLSSSPSFLVEPLAKRLAIADWMASEYGVNDEKRLSHIVSLVQGKDKAAEVGRWMKVEGIARENVVAYSDSYHDLPILLQAGRAVAVNPDRKLRDYCRKAQWQII